jgi:L-malate glycosyltransferase
MAQAAGSTLRMHEGQAIVKQIQSIRGQTSSGTRRCRCRQGVHRLLRTRQVRKQGTSTPSRLTRTANRDGAVLIVTPWYRPTVGGVAEVSERLRSGLAGKGMETHLLVRDERHSLVQDQTVPNLWRTAIPSYMLKSLRPKAVAGNVIRGIPALWRLYRFIRRHQIRSVLLVYPVDYAWPFLLLRILTGIRLIASLHGSDVRRYGDYAPALRWLLRRTLHASEIITVPSLQLASIVEETFPGLNSRIRVIPNGVDTEWFTPAAGPSGAPQTATVVHISNFAPLKRTVDIVGAFASADIPPTTRLVFVGDGPSLAETRERAHTLGIADRTDFIGAVTDVRSPLRKASVLVLLSDVETAPLVLLEAMACGVPWVATPFGVAAEVPDGQCGIVVPPRAPDLAAKAIAALVNDPQRARSMGELGREIASRDYSFQRYISQYLELLLSDWCGPLPSSREALNKEPYRRGNIDPRRRAKDGGALRY